MVDISVDDARQKFEGSLIIYNNRPCIVERINVDFECRVFNILEQEESVVAFSRKEFKPMMRRIGMINIDGSAVYAYRQPLRQYKLGLHRDNIVVHSLPGTLYPQGREAALRKINTLKSTELGRALMDKYPSLSAAVKRVSQFEGAMAFDKQFAITSEMLIIYKRLIVGEYRNNQIYFKPEYEYLETLLSKNYEKTIRAI